MNQDLSGKPSDRLAADFAEIEAATDHVLAESEAICIAAGKKLCATCQNKAKGEWRCESKGFPASDRHCPATYGCRFFFPKPAVQRPPQPKKKGLPVSPGVKLLYFGRPEGVKTCHLGPYPVKGGSREHQGVVTVAWIEPSPGTLHLGFSFCSPKDPWCKTTGRDIALTRLLHPVVIPFLYSSQRTVHEVARAIMSHDFKRLAAIAPGVTMWGITPSWTKDLAKKMWPPHRHTKLFIWKCPPLTHTVNVMSAEFSSEAWERLPKTLWRRTRPRPHPSPLDILTRMAVDLAGLGRAAD